MGRRAAKLAVVAVAGVASLGGQAWASTPASDVRLTNDAPGTGGYVSDYTLVTGKPYTDDTLQECSRARGRQNEPSVAIDPRNPSVVIGSSNDYCGVYNDGEDANGAPIPSGPIWVGYYRSQNGGRSFVSSLTPGYPGDTSPFARRSQLRTASAGDAVLAWDLQGRVFLGTETSADAAGTKKGFGDVGVATYSNPAGPAGPTSDDGKEFTRSVIVDRGSSSPGTGQFNDKTSIEVDRTGGRCAGNVYFSYSRFTGAGGVGIQFTRSTNHGQSFSQPKKLSASIHDVQFPDIAVASNGNVYVTFRQFSTSAKEPDAVLIAKSTDCGASFSKPKLVQTFIPYDAQDVPGEAEAPQQTSPDDPASAEDEEAAGSTARDCGDFAAACRSGYTFFRQDSGPRSTADQLAPAGDESVYIVYDATIPGTQVDTGTTFGSIRPGVGSQKGVFFVRYDGATGKATAPKLVDSRKGQAGQQLFPDLAIEGGPLHLLWWDSRNDACYSPARPIGNCADRSLVPALDVYATRSTNRGGSFAASQRVSDVTTNPNFEQFGGRTVPFAGDYLWISAIGDTSYGVWTDWRDTVGGVDQRESDEEAAPDTYTGDVLQCRNEVSPDVFTGDLCPRSGGLDQNIYGDGTP